ncbi:MAG: prepilin-type N-terminal cleavage/methylation domain-containing protein [Candidatus Paceibacterota bacterium]|jgi:type II secretory pathway component PulJ
MKKTGYTLIEIMVSVSVFFVVSASLITFFSNSLKSQREILASQEMVDNISYAMEYMSRALRMAVKDDIEGTGCLLGSKVNYELTRSGDGIKFQNYENSCQEFFLENGRIKEWKSESGVISEDYLTSENIEVDYFTIESSGSWDQDDDLQAEVTIYLQARTLLTADLSMQPEIKIQTSVSQRNLDVRY